MGFSVEVEGKACLICDWSINDFVLIPNGPNDGIAFYHKTLIEHNLSDQIIDYAINSIIYDDPIAELNRRLVENYFDSSDKRTKMLPIDAVRSSSHFPKASDYLDGYYFCPNCVEASKPLHVYDEAICCEKCETLFNLQ